MHIPTYLAKSKIHGIGVFTRDPVRAGTTVWSFTPGFDVLLKPGITPTLSEVHKAYVATYGWPSITIPGGTVLACDNGRFFNHSDTPNCRSGVAHLANEVSTTAVSNIAAGEELTDDYRSFGADVPTTRGWFSRLRCVFGRHARLAWIRTIHGDEIALCGGKRTVFICRDCGKVVFHTDYITRAMAIDVYEEKQ